MWYKKKGFGGKNDYKLESRVGQVNGELSDLGRRNSTWESLVFFKREGGFLTESKEVQWRQ